LILKSFKIIPLQLRGRVLARVLACLLSDGLATKPQISINTMTHLPGIYMAVNVGVLVRT
jgi:hypothetical protein